MSARASSAAIEDTMFFTRLRRHAKWMFVFLALVFGVGFVAFGIGSGGTGIGDIFRGNSGTSGLPSVSDALAATEEDPQNAEAWRDLSTALQTGGETGEAIVALERYVDLRPKDASALRELGGLHLTQGVLKRQEAQNIQLQAQLSGASSPFSPSLIVNGVDRFQNNLSRALEAQVNGELNMALFESSVSYTQAVVVYRRLAETSPTDPSVQLELAQAAEQASSTETAIRAYERFLELAPADPNAPIIKQQLQRLRGASG